jgi:hypothetical protein
MPTFTPHTPPPHERLIDEMVDETFPASDAPQLTERRHDPAVAPEPPPRTAREQLERGQPPAIGNQGTLPQSRIQEETITVSDQGAVTLRFDGEFRHLHIYLGEEGMALDAKAADKLIAVLSAKRAQMQE